MDNSVPVRERTHVDLRRGIFRQHAACVVHDDSSEGKTFNAGRQIDLRLGRCLECTSKVSNSPSRWPTTLLRRSANELSSLGSSSLDCRRSFTSQFLR